MPDGGSGSGAERGFLRTSELVALFRDGPPVVVHPTEASPWLRRSAAVREEDEPRPHGIPTRAPNREGLDNNRGVKN